MNQLNNPPPFPKIRFFRARPGLGTLVQFHFEIEPQGKESDLNSSDPQVFARMEQVYSECSQRIHELEKVFNIWDSQSEISQLNRKMKCGGTQKNEAPELLTPQNLFEDLERKWAQTFSSDFKLVYEKARAAFFVSKGAFNPFFRGDHSLDLNGLAKGFAVDQCVELVTQELPEVSGSINAGGDLRYFGPLDPIDPVHLRLGSPQHPLTRELKTNRRAVATSSRFGIDLHSESRTCYPPHSRLDESYSCVCLADQTVSADLMTKIAFFADETTLKLCEAHFSTQALIFDSQGHLVRRPT